MSSDRLVWEASSWLQCYNPYCDSQALRSSNGLISVFEAVDRRVSIIVSVRRAFEFEAETAPISFSPSSELARLRLLLDRLIRPAKTNYLYHIWSILYVHTKQGCIMVYTTYDMGRIKHKLTFSIGRDSSGGRLSGSFECGRCETVTKITTKG